MLAAFIEYASPNRDLYTLLYLVRAISWILALSAASFIFRRSLKEDRLTKSGAILFAAVSVFLFYPCEGFLTAYAEEHCIQVNRAYPLPGDDMGSNYLYGSFSPGTGGSSRGAMDAPIYVLRGLGIALYMMLIWLPLVWFVARCSYGKSPDSY